MEFRAVSNDRPSPLSRSKSRGEGECLGETVRKTGHRSIHGKTPIGVARMAKRYGKPVIGIAGCLSGDAGVVHGHGIDAVFSVLSRVGTLEEALTQAASNVRVASRNVAAILKLAREIQPR